MQALIGLIILIILYQLIRAFYGLIITVYGLITTHWQMIVLVIFGLIVLRIAYHLLIYLPWLNRLKKASLLRLKNSDKYLIPLYWEKKPDWASWQLTCVYPYLSNGHVMFSEEMFCAYQVKRVNSRGQGQPFLSVMQQLVTPTQTIYQDIMPQMGELQRQINELNRLKQLALSSEVYYQKGALYERAIAQLNQLHKASEELRVQSISYIRELLIGLELAQFDSDILPDPLEYQLTIQTKYQLISEQLEQLKLEVDTYQSLTQQLR
jgi:hypothetical protein